MILRVGTRGSLLARTQTAWVVACLQAEHRNLEIQTEIIQTTGDKHQDVPFPQVGTKGMFVKELEQALIKGTIDIAVHSLKDMPLEQPKKLALLCFPEAEDPRDALISRKGETFETLPNGAVIGTSSIRRKAQLWRLHRELQFKELRGNVDTRLRKLDEGEYDAIVLAVAGLERLGLRDRITEYLEPEVCTPAVGQGVLVVEGRKADKTTRELLAVLNDPDTVDRVRAERSFLEAAGGGCHSAIGALAVVEGDTITLRGMVASANDYGRLATSASAPRSEAEQLGVQVAANLYYTLGREVMRDSIFAKG